MHVGLQQTVEGAQELQTRCLDTPALQFANVRTVVNLWDNASATDLSKSLLGWLDFLALATWFDG